MQIDGFVEITIAISHARFRVARAAAIMPRAA
jgi:hypothetical protein